MNKIWMYEINNLESKEMYHRFYEHVKCQECYDNITRIALGYLNHHPQEGKLYTICFGSWSAYGDGVFNQHCFLKKDNKIIDQTYYTLDKHSYRQPLYTIYKEYTVDEFVEIALKEDEEEWSIRNIILNKLPYHMELLKEKGYFTIG